MELIEYNQLISQGMNPMRISRQVAKGELGNCGYGFYSVKPNVLAFECDSTMNHINEILDSFTVPPERVVFSSISLNFAINQLISGTTYLIEVEKDYAEAVFLALKDEFDGVVLLKPSAVEKTNYWKPGAIYVVDLFSRSPTNKDGTIPIEKLIVDLLFNEDMYGLFTSRDVDQAVPWLLKEYQVNYRTLFAYASRKGKHDALFHIAEPYIPNPIKALFRNS